MTKSTCLDRVPVDLETRDNHNTVRKVCHPGREQGCWSFNKDLFLFISLRFIPELHYKQTYKGERENMSIWFHSYLLLNTEMEKSQSGGHVSEKNVMKVFSPSPYILQELCVSYNS